jgi:hypothetical protein
MAIATYSTIFLQFGEITKVQTTTSKKKVQTKWGLELASLLPVS